MKIFTSVRNAWQNTKDMPFLLRMYCQGAMVVAPLLLLFLALPLFDWTVDDKPVSYAQLWNSGMGVALGLCLALAGLGAWGLAARLLLARWASVATPLAPFVALPLFPASSSLSVLKDTSLVASALLTSVVVYAMLFHIPSVRRYLVHAGEQRT